MTGKKFKQRLSNFLENKASKEDIEILDRFEKFFLEKNQSKVFKNESQKKQIKRDIYKRIRRENTEVQFSPLLKVAASIVIVFTIGITAFNWQSNGSLIFANDQSQPKIITLPDNSTIFLNTNSKLIYKSSFKERKVTLEGEAFFDIQKDKQKPFLIKTNNLTTKVVGTKFNIRQDVESIKVTVSEGKVKVYKEKDTLTLIPNQQAIFNKLSNILLKEEVNSQLYDLWRKDKVTLKGVTLKELTNVFQSLFNVNFIFKDEKLKFKLYSITFKKSESIEEIINRINLINEIKITLKKKNMAEIELIKQ